MGLKTEILGAIVSLQEVLGDRTDKEGVVLTLAEPGGKEPDLVYIPIFDIGEGRFFLDKGERGFGYLHIGVQVVARNGKDEVAVPGITGYIGVWKYFGSDRGIKPICLEIEIKWLNGIIIRAFQVVEHNPVHIFDFR